MDELTTGELLIIHTSIAHVQIVDNVGPFAPLFKSAYNKIGVELEKRPDYKSERNKHILMIHNKLN